MNKQSAPNFLAIYAINSIQMVIEYHNNEHISIEHVCICCYSVSLYHTAHKCMVSFSNLFNKPYKQWVCEFKCSHMSNLNFARFIQILFYLYFFLASDHMILHTQKYMVLNRYEYFLSANVRIRNVLWIFSKTKINWKTNRDTEAGFRTLVNFWSVNMHRLHTHNVRPEYQPSYSM